MTSVQYEKMQDVPAVLRAQAKRKGSQIAFRFLRFGDGEDACITYAELDHRAKAIACVLQERGMKGERVLLLYPPGLEYVAGLFGCLYAGAVAVPAYPPDARGREKKMARLMAMIDDARIGLGLTIHAIATSAGAVASSWERADSIDLIATDVLDYDLAREWSDPKLEGRSPALLQYTSGSTGRPRGVMLDHVNLVSNLQMIHEVSGLREKAIGVSWLPPYHDMGLIGSIIYMYFAGATCCLMSPEAFLRKPIRWLEAISRYRAGYSVAPNFGFEMAVARTSEEQRQELDLSCWEVAFDGAEPISAAVIDEFVRTFEPYGFRREVIVPCYGMAEATLIISAGPAEAEPVVRPFDAQALARGRVREPEHREAKVRTLVGCGRAILGEEIRIVDPDTCMECPDDTVGEVWVRGPSVGRGYWRQAEDTERTFRARLLPGNQGPFLRTGDLGVFHRGELFITGRLKDLIIVRGLNHYPQDIESTVQAEHSALRKGCGAAFSVECDGQEQVVVVQELDERGAPDIAALLASIPMAVGREHDVALREVVLIKRGSILRTSSGKIQRRATKEAYLLGRLQIVARWCRAASGAPEGSRAGACAQNERVVTAEASPLDTPASSERSEQRMAGAAEDVQHIACWLQQTLASLLNVSPERILSSEPFAQYGLDSVVAVQLAQEMEQWLGLRVDSGIFYDYPTIEAVARHVAAGSPAGADGGGTATGSKRFQGLAADEPMAIIGMSCRFPGAEDVDGFWELLRRGRDAIREVPADRWDVQQFYDSNLRQPGKMDTRWGGFLDGVGGFDAEFFGIAAREAEGMDPQQRLLLEVAWEALENAGLAPGSLAGSDTGVFIGISANDYARLHPEDCSLVDAFFGTGNAHSIAANRLSYLLDLQGPSMAVDTACSSSLAAMHTAVQSLRWGECGLAIVGGVNIILSPETMIGFSHAGMMSPDGRCRAFDAAADGYARSEGAGVLILKPLSSAERDGDRICALIRGSAVSHGGRGNGLTAPRGPAQQRVIRQALGDASVKPAEVSYVETHGSGTLIGDAIELKALGEVLKEGRPAEQRCWVGSVKTNVGSLEAASGMAAVIKTVLAMQHQKLPAHLHLRQVNRDIPMDELPLEIPTSCTVWPRGEKPRIAGVSSFAFGGVNAHVVLQEAPPCERPKLEGKAVIDRPFHLLCLSAKHPDALRQLAHAFSRQSLEHALADLCFSANTGRNHFDHRLAVVADDVRKLHDGLRSFAEGRAHPSLVSGQVKLKSEGGPIWLFGDWERMPVKGGRELLQSEPRFRRTFRLCDEIAARYVGESFFDVLNSGSGGLTALSPILAAVHAFALGDALAALWTAWGITPTAVTGEGVGEYVAAHRAGILSKEEAIELVCRFVQVREDGLQKKGRLQYTLGDSTREVRPNPVRIPFISSADGICYPKGDRPPGGFISSADGICYPKGDRPPGGFISSADGICYPKGDRPPGGYWHESMQQKPNASAIRSALMTMQPCLIQPCLIQPCLNQTWLIQQSWSSAVGDALSGPLGDLHLANALVPQHSEWESVLMNAGVLYVRGYDLDWASLDSIYRRRKVALPTYPFQRRRYWLPLPEKSGVPVAHEPPPRSSHPFIHRRSSRVGPERHN